MSWVWGCLLVADSPLGHSDHAVWGAFAWVALEGTPAMYHALLHA